MKASSKHVAEQLALLPQKPGVYIFRDSEKKVLYVGKAKRLTSRVRSYFQEGHALEPRKEPMIGLIRGIETIITSTEQEALLLEATLIKQYQPPYNILLKDDKYFLYIRVTMSDEFPTVDVVRKITDRRDVYFGPFTGAASVRETLKTLKMIFKFRTCTPHSSKACFDYTINRCLGVCIGEISVHAYREVIEELIAFLKGKGEDVIAKLHTDMTRASQQKKFEQAARIRDRITALERLMRRQTVISQKPDSFDVIGMAKEKRYTVVALLRIRSGKLLDKQEISVSQAQTGSEADILQAFIEQYYSQVPEQPKTLFTEVKPTNARLLSATFHFTISRPQRGEKRALTALAHENAQHGLQSMLASFEKNDAKTTQALKAIQKRFELPSLPSRIESYDIANISGKHSVGSMAVFIDGKPKKDLYKKFSIKTVNSQNDPAMLAEVVGRRMLRMRNNERGWEAPNLIILDGGKGQLSVVKKHIGNTPIPIVALAKGGHQDITRQSQREHFFTYDGKELTLPAPSPELFLLERLRDEAHRFATTFYKSKHVKSQQTSQLDAVPGIGPKRKKALLRHFGSVQRIRQAKKKEIADIIGEKATEILLANIR